MSNSEKLKIQSYLKSNACVLDVRSEEEYKEGHVKNSVHIPLELLPHNIEKIRSFKKSIITVCRSGNRSGMAADFLNQMGIKSINGGPWKHIAKYVDSV